MQIEEAGLFRPAAAVHFCIGLNQKKYFEDWKFFKASLNRANFKNAIKKAWVQFYANLNG